MEKIKSMVKNVFTYWKTPPAGRYMTFKEIASLSVGGIGVRMVTNCIAQMILSSTNVLIGNTIGIDPTPLYIIYILGIISSFPLTALRAKMIDNSRSMKGKYRPYIISMGIPTFILGCGFIWAPYERMGLVMKCVVVLLFNIGFQFFYNFYLDSYESLINVLSPNSIERSDVLSIRYIVENLSPSIINIAMPLIAKAITGQNTLYDLKIYRWSFPFLMFFGLLISILVYTNTQEKIVQAKTHVIQIRFSDALRAIARNKHFWIFSLAGWLGFLEGAMGNLIAWMYNYQQACSAAQYAVIIAIAGNASLWPNIVTPFLIRRYGKKAILVGTNLLNIVFIACMLPIVRLTGSSYIIWLLLASTFINTLISGIGHLLGPSINADIRDYQQYISGERIDGMFAAVGLIGNVITLVTGLAIPALYQRAGLNKATAISLGYDGSNVYDVLYDQAFFVKIASVLVIASVIGAVMNVIPMFFYDLTESDQKGMVAVLKIRAMFEDYGNGVLTDESMKEAALIIEESEQYKNKEKVSAALMKSLNRRQKKEARELNEKISVANRVAAELERFETDQGKADLAHAKRIAQAGLEGYLSIDIPTKAQAKAMPKNTEAEKEARRSTLMLISNTNAARKAQQKYFPNGIKEFDSSVFEKLFAEEYENEKALAECLEELKTAKENKDTIGIRDARIMSEKIKAEKKTIEKQIKEATDANSLYSRAAKPYLDAKRLIVQSENYADYEAIKAKMAAAR